MAPWSAILSRRPSASAFAVSAKTRPRPRRPLAADGFTLIELILVMAILTVAVSFTAPTMSRFFSGRTLDSEARRLLAFTRLGQGRAVSEGLTMDLWLDAEHRKLGLEVQRSFDTSDPKKEELDLDAALRLEVSTKNTGTSNLVSQTGSISMASILKSAPTHPNLPTIHFQPDGSIGDNSPESLRLIARDGDSVWVALAKNRMRYEIRNTEN